MYYLCRYWMIMEKIDKCKINRKNLCTAKVSEHIPSSFSMSTISLFKSIEKKHDVYRGKNCMKNFGEYSREHAMKKKLNFKKMKSLTKE